MQWKCPSTASTAPPPNSSPFTTTTTPSKTRSLCWSSSIFSAVLPREPLMTVAASLILLKTPRCGTTNLNSRAHDGIFSTTATAALSIGLLATIPALTHASSTSPGASTSTLQSPTRCHHLPSPPRVVRLQLSRRSAPRTRSTATIPS